MILSRFVYTDMKLADIVMALEPLQVLGAVDRVVKGLSYDSRMVSPDFVFVALPGLQEDGNRYIHDAVERGAVAVVSEHTPSVPRGVAFIQVANARQALADIACAFHRHPASRLECLGVTGTNGKTTVTWLLKAILDRDGRRPGLMGTVAHHIGDRQIPASRTTPESPELQAMMDQMGQAGCQSVVMEVSSHALTQDRVRGIGFQVAVFTNLTRDHLDFHGDMEAYFQAKRALFTGLSNQAQAVMNLDDPFGKRLWKDEAVQAGKLTFSMHENADVMAHDLQLGLGGTQFKLVTPWGHAMVATKLLGRFNVSNILAAVAGAGALGISLDDILAVVSEAKAPPGRLEPVASPKGKIFVDYAHTDQALANVLGTLRELCPGRIGVVFGCGGCRDRDKRPLMAKAVEQGADFAVVTNDNPRQEEPSDIAADILRGFSPAMEVRVVLDRRDAIQQGLSQLGEQDVLLVAGKGHENYMEFNSTVVPFDDRTTIMEIVRSVS